MPVRLELIPKPIHNPNQDACMDGFSAEVKVAVEENVDYYKASYQNYVP